MTTVDDCLYCLAQFEIVLDCCPKSPFPGDLESMNRLLIPDTVVTVVFNGDENWTQAKSKLTSVVQMCKKIKNSLVENEKYKKFLRTLSKTDNFVVSDVILTFEDDQMIQEGFTMFHTIKQEVKDIEDLFKMTNEKDNNPVCDCLTFLQEKINKSLSKFIDYQGAATDVESGSGENYEISDSEMKSSLQLLFNKVLFAVQQVYKSSTQSVCQDTDIEKVMEFVNLNFNNLKLQDVSEQLHSLLVQCKSTYCRIPHIR